VDITFFSDPYEHAGPKMSKGIKKGSKRYASPSSTKDLDFEPDLSISLAGLKSW
jgi:hypothetical protein